MNASYAPHDLIGSECRRPRLTVIIVNHESWPDVLRLSASLMAEPEFASGLCRSWSSTTPRTDQFPLRSWRHNPVSNSWPGSRMAVSPSASMPAGEPREAPGSWYSIRMWKSREVSWARSWRSSPGIDADPDRPPGIVGFGLRNPDGSPQGSVGAFPNLARTVWEQFIPRRAGNTRPVGEFARVRSTG